MRKTTLSQEQSREWQRLLSGFLQRQRLGFKTTKEDKIIRKWYLKYIALMNEKLNILKKLNSEKSNILKKLNSE